MTTKISLSDAFDGGNGEPVAVGGGVAQVRIKKDPLTELEKKHHSQWFYFRSLVTFCDGSSSVVSYEIVNAAEVSFAVAWPGSSVCYSTDRKSWKRVWNTSYSDGKLKWSFDHADAPSVFFAYFEPFSHDRHLDLVLQCQASPAARVHSLGKTLDGRELDCITVGRGKLQAWVIARQHPGEPQAEHYAWGLLDRLLGLETAGRVDGLAMRLLKDFTFHVVPNMNPDGSLRGHLRTNACGANLNREWATTGEYVAPTLERSPEVYHALAAMDATGVDVFADVHGDEALPFTFVSGAEGCPTWAPRMRALQGAFVGAYARANPDMQAEVGYEPDAPNGANLAICSNQIATRFDCVAVTLEMPFKDCASNPSTAPTDPGFDGFRCAMLGRSLLDAIAYVGPQLRGVAEPSFALTDDAHVPPFEEPERVAALVAKLAAAAVCVSAAVPQVS